MHAVQPIAVGILGPLQVRVGPDRPTIAGARLRRLLLRLTVDAGSVVSSGELLDAVWTGDETRPDGATNALQSLVSRLRRVLGSTVVQQLRGGYRLAVDKTDVDAYRFASLAARGRRELRAGDAETALATLDDALSLWQGNPLSDADGAPYAESVVARLGEQRIQATGDLFDAHIALGRAADVVAQIEEVAAADLLQEAFTGQLMTALAAAGRTSEALVAYERLRQRLAEELGVDPDPRLQAQHLALLRGEDVVPSVRPSPASPKQKRTNIRASLTSFIGRDAELRRICELLEVGRLTTIIGPGGAGKTRLSAQVAALWDKRAADGVWMVELASVTEAVNIGPAMLLALGLRDAKVLDRQNDRAARDSIDRLFESLEDSETLLVVDNCEHLIAPVAELIDAILSRCPGVRVLATSREPLGIVGESLCVIPPLGLPPVAATASEAAGYPAVQLLCERAAAVSADFRVDKTNVRDVIEIVRRLDGLPLAIELAAARLRVLPVAEIASRLSDRFRLLSGGNRTAMPRHRTLRAVVEWSWDLLSPAERLLAERLSVFPAGSTEDAATVICAGGPLSADSVPDLLLSLVDKSLLQVVGEHGLRYRMLETIREYGIERLAERGEAGSARAAHARYFAALAERLEPVLRGRDQLAAIGILNAEQDNIVAALRFLGDAGDVDRAIGMALALVWHWTMTASHTEIVTWMDFLLQLPAAAAHRWIVYVRTARAISMLSTGQADFSDNPLGIRTEFAEIADELDGAPPPPSAPIIIMAPVLSFFSDDDKRALRLSEDLLASDDLWIRAAVRTMRASFAENSGDLESMRTDVAAALGDFETIGDRWGLSTALNSRAWIRTLDGDSYGAIADYERAVGYLNEIGGQEDDLLVHLRLCGLRIRIGDLGGAKKSLDAARGIGATGPHAAARQMFADGAQAYLLLLEGDTVGALEITARLRRGIGSRGESPWMRGHVAAMVFSATAGISLRLGRLEEAADDVDFAYPLARDTKDMPIVAVLGVWVAGLAAARGQLSRAAFMLGACARLRGGDDFNDPSVAWVMEKLDAAGDPGLTAEYEDGKSQSVDASIAALDPSMPG